VLPCLRAASGAPQDTSFLFRSLILLLRTMAITRTPLGAAVVLLLNALGAEVLRAASMVIGFTDNHKHQRNGRWGRMAQCARV
jgi:hypothetical protein